MQPRSLVWPARDGLRCLPGGLPNNRYAPTIRGGATSLQGAVSRAFCAIKRHKGAFCASFYRLVSLRLGPVENFQTVSLETVWKVLGQRDGGLRLASWRAG